MSTQVLVAEDDRAVRDSVTRALEWEGYQVAAVADGPSALVAAADADLILLDVMMPGLDGLRVCKTLREQGSTVPILIMTARTETSERVSGLDAGADDYLAKPFALAELFARIRALLRRSQLPEAAAPSQPEVLAVRDLRVEPATRRAWRGDREIPLSRTEFNLLELLVRNEGVVLAHSTIYERIWGYDFGPESKNLTVYVSYLRRKLDAEANLKLIHTIRGVGYTLRAS